MHLYELSKSLSYRLYDSGSTIAQASVELLIAKNKIKEHNTPGTFTFEDVET